MAGAELPWRERLRSASAWSAVAHNFRNDWQMLYREIFAGFLLAGFIAQFGNGFFDSLFLRHAPQPLPTLENVIVGPLVAVASFVCSVGNVPLAAILWSGGISFAGVLAFIFADLIVLPIIAIYRKYYGTRYAVRIVALMLLTMIIAALIVNALFGLTGILPSGPRPTRADVFGHIRVDYKLALNALGVVIFATLFALTARRGATDPECGMKVDRGMALSVRADGRTVYFCSPACLQAFETRQELGGSPPPAPSPPPDREQDDAHCDLCESHGGAEGVARATAEGRADV
jgi:YHS domain-containing protein